MSDEQPFLYTESYEPPPGQGFTRYASAELVRSDCRKFWTNGFLRWVMDDFGYLTYVGWSFIQ